MVEDLTFLLCPLFSKYFSMKIFSCIIIKIQQFSKESIITNFIVLGVEVDIHNPSWEAEAMRCQV